MSNKRHNKKRNLGLIYELLLNYVSKNLIEGNKKEAEKATKIIEKHFRKGTELYKEFRIFNAIAQSDISNTHIVASILNEAKNAIRNNIDNQILESQKSRLIRDINYSLSKDFYYASIANYRDLATIQLTINEWKKKSPDIKNLVEFETKIGQIMLDKSSNNNIVNDRKLNISHSDKLVFKLMQEKFNKKYGTDLSKDQKMIINNYIFYADKDREKLKEFFQAKKNHALVLLEKFEDDCENKHLLSKIDSVRLKINEVNVNQVNDESVVKFLSLTKLIDELNKGV